MTEDNKLFPAKWVRNEKHTNRRSPVIGEIWIFDGKEVVITGGSFWGNYGVSNFWNFVFPDGSTGGSYDNNRDDFYPKPLKEKGG